MASQKVKGKSKKVRVKNIFEKIFFT